MHPMAIAGIVIGSVFSVILIAVLIVYIINKKSTFVCDNCGHRFKAKFSEILISPHAFSKVALTCPKCGEIGATKE